MEDQSSNLELEELSHRLAEILPVHSKDSLPKMSKVIMGSSSNSPHIALVGVKGGNENISSGTDSNYCNCSHLHYAVVGQSVCTWNLPSKLNGEDGSCTTKRKNVNKKSQNIQESSEHCLQPFCIPSLQSINCRMRAETLAHCVHSDLKKESLKGSNNENTQKRQQNPSNGSLPRLRVVTSEPTLNLCHLMQENEENYIQNRTEINYSESKARKSFYIGTSEDQEDMGNKIKVSEDDSIQRKGGARKKCKMKLNLSNKTTDHLRIKKDRSVKQDQSTSDAIELRKTKKALHKINRPLTNVTKQNDALKIGIHSCSKDRSERNIKKKRKSKRLKTVEDACSNVENSKDVLVKEDSNKKGMSESVSEGQIKEDENVPLRDEQRMSENISEGQIKEDENVPLMGDFNKESIFITLEYGDIDSPNTDGAINKENNTTTSIEPCSVQNNIPSDVKDNIFVIPNINETNERSNNFKYDMQKGYESIERKVALGNSVIKSEIKMNTLINNDNTDNLSETSFNTLSNESIQEKDINKPCPSIKSNTDWEEEEEYKERIIQAVEKQVQELEQGLLESLTLDSPSKSETIVAEFQILCDTSVTFSIAKSPKRSVSTPINLSSLDGKKSPNNDTTDLTPKDENSHMLIDKQARSKYSHNLSPYEHYDTPQSPLLEDSTGIEESLQETHRGQGCELKNHYIVNDIRENMCSNRNPISDEKTVNSEGAKNYIKSNNQIGTGQESNKVEDGTCLNSNDTCIGTEDDLEDSGNFSLYMRETSCNNNGDSGYPSDAHSCESLENSFDSKAHSDYPSARYILEKDLNQKLSKFKGSYNELTDSESKDGHLHKSLINKENISQSVCDLHMIHTTDNFEAIDTSACDVVNCDISMENISIPGLCIEKHTYDEISSKVSTSFDDIAEDITIEDNLSILDITSKYSTDIYSPPMKQKYNLSLLPVTETESDKLSITSGESISPTTFNNLPEYVETVDELEDYSESLFNNILLEELNRLQPPNDLKELLKAKNEEKDINDSLKQENDMDSLKVHTDTCTARQLFKKRSSSLKFCKTPPDQQHLSKKKIVKFADGFGLDLVDVKTFIEGIPQVPRSAFSHLQLQVEEKETPRRSFKTSFKNPVEDPLFWARIETERVCLSQVVLGDDLSVRGVIRVLNICFKKTVIIKYTFDHWKTHHKTTATYLSGSSDGRTDQFSFLLWGNFLQDNGTLVFCICYQTAGQEYWDNNQGEDYKLQCYAMPSHIKGQERSSRSRQQASQQQIAQTESLYSNFERLREHSPADPWLHRYL